MEVQFFIGDVDEFYCDAVEGDCRWAVWSQTNIPLEANDPRRDRGAVSRVQTTLLARFDTEDEALQFIDDYDVGVGNTKIVG